MVYPTDLVGFLWRVPLAMFAGWWDSASRYFNVATRHVSRYPVIADCCQSTLANTATRHVSRSLHRVIHFPLLLRVTSVGAHCCRVLHGAVSYCRRTSRHLVTLLPRGMSFIYLLVVASQPLLLPRVTIQYSRCSRSRVSSGRRCASGGY